MNTITLTIAATPDNLKRLAEAFGDAIDENFPKDAMPARRITSTGPAEKTIESTEIKLPENAAEPNENVAKEPENVAEPNENVAKEPENVAEAPQRTLSELRAKAAQLVKDGHKDDLKALLGSFGAPKVPELKQEDWNAFYERMEAIA